MGTSFVCARSTTQVACWGSNKTGGFGLNTAQTVNATPVLLPGITGPLTRLTPGDHGMCVIDNGTAACWGIGSGAQPIAGLPAVIALTRQIHEATYHQCALDTAGTAWCWGSTSNGELGRGNTTPDQNPATIMEAR